jgi:hypothetical protein
MVFLKNENYKENYQSNNGDNEEKLIKTFPSNFFNSHYTNVKKILINLYEL